MVFAVFCILDCITDKFDIFLVAVTIVCGLNTLIVFNSETTSFNVSSTVSLIFSKFNFSFNFVLNKSTLFNSKSSSSIASVAASPILDTKSKNDFLINVDFLSK